MRTRAMKVLGTCCMGVALVLPLSLAVPEASHAACESNQRTGHSSAQCLDAGWSNSTRSWGRKRTNMWAQNKCASWGKVVAKVDIAAASDKTWHLTTGNRRTGSANAHTRKISCCRDLSDLCNTSDVLTSAGCLAQFNKSPAVTSGGSRICAGNQAKQRSTFNSNNYTLETAMATVSGETCAITAQCDVWHQTPGNFKTTVTTTAHYTETDELNLCSSGRLQKTC